MRETNEEALRRQPFIRMMGLVFAGQGVCPGCRQKKEVFVPRRAIPDMRKERWLDCWKAER